MAKWLINSGAVVGRSHLKADPVVPCQDKVKTLQSKSVNALALSDGCGSSAISQYGAQTTVDILCEVLVNNFNYLYQLDSVELKKFIISKLIEGLKQFISTNPDIINEFKVQNPNHYDNFINNWQGYKTAEKIYPITLLDATVQFVAVKGDKAIIGRLGDGVIGEVENKSLKILSMEDKIGVEDNATVYPSTIMLALENPNLNPWNAFEIIKLENLDNISMFLICSDGVGDVIVGEDQLTKFLYLDEVTYLLDDFSNIENVLENKYKKYKGIYDDLSVCLMKKQNVQIESITIREYDESGKTIENSQTHKIDIDKIEQEIETLSQPAKDEEIVNLPPEISKLINKKVRKDLIDYFALNTSKMIKFMTDKDEVTAENLLNYLGQDVDDLDLMQMRIYWEKFKLIKYDKQTNTFARSESNIWKKNQ